MRLIIAGSRDEEGRMKVEYGHICIAVREARRAWKLGAQGLCDKAVFSAVLSGRAPTGADVHGERWGYMEGIPVEMYPANWPKYGKAAGPIRNREMASKADALVAVQIGNSPGTANMVMEARKRGLKVFVYRPEDDPYLEKP